MARTLSPRRRVSRSSSIPFAHKLVLNQWQLGLFNVKRFEDLAEHLRNEALEGLDENNVHHFHHALTAQLFDLPQLPAELLLEYDHHIGKHTQRLNERRIMRGEEPLIWKYFPSSNDLLSMLDCQRSAVQTLHTVSEVCLDHYPLATEQESLTPRHEPRAACCASAPCRC